MKRAILAAAAAIACSAAFAGQGLEDHPVATMAELETAVPVIADAVKAGKHSDLCFIDRGPAFPGGASSKCANMADGLYVWGDVLDKDGGQQNFALRFHDDGTVSAIVPLSYGFVVPAGVRKVAGQAFTSLKLQESSHLNDLTRRVAFAAMTEDFGARADKFVKASQ